MSQLVQCFSISVVHLCFVLFSMYVCVCVCVCMCVYLWLFLYSGSLAGAIDGADNAHSQGTPTPDMVETAQQPAGWWILTTEVKFTGFWGVNMYNILDF